MQKIKITLVAAVLEPVHEIVRDLIGIVNFINVILNKRFGKSRAPAIPDHASLVDSRDKERKCVVLNVVGQMTIRLIASLIHQYISILRISVNEPTEVVEISMLSKGRWHVAVFVVFRLLARQIDQTRLNTQLLLHTSCMLLR